MHPGGNFDGTQVHTAGARAPVPHRDARGRDGRNRHRGRGHERDHQERGSVRQEVERGEGRIDHSRGQPHAGPGGSSGRADHVGEGLQQEVQRRRRSLHRGRLVRPEGRPERGGRLRPQDRRQRRSGDAQRHVSERSRLRRRDPQERRRSPRRRQPRLTGAQRSELVRDRSRRRRHHVHDGAAADPQQASRRSG